MTSSASRSSKTRPAERSSKSASKDDERGRWNEKYRNSLAGMAPLTADPFLRRGFSEYVRPLFPLGGSALDFAGGAGRHAIWLAKQGWKVTLIDISEAGVEQARKNAATLGTQIHLVVDDLTHFKASQTEFETRFDLVICFFYLDRQSFPEMIRALRPGGLLICKTFTLAQKKLGSGPKNPAHLLKPEELKHLATGLRILHYREEVQERATAELVARKEM